MPAPCGPIIIEALANKWTNNDLQNIAAQKTKN
jgi:hypothetical protein